MPQNSGPSETPESVDPYRPTASGPGDLGPLPPPAPPILWIVPGSFVSLFVFTVLAVVIGEAFHEAAMVPLVGVWLALLVWSIWITASKRADAWSIFARSYLLANALVALLVGVIGTSCSGMSFGASSGGDGSVMVLFLLLCILAVAAGLFAFRWPRKA